MTKKKELKKRVRREDKKHPFLDKSYNLKSRRDYIDNTYYVNGVKDVKGKTVMRELTEEEKDFLNKFNAEYYCASFDKDDNNNLHKYKASKDQLNEVREYIKELKQHIKTLEKTNASKEKLRSLYREVEATREQLLELNPKLKCTDANNLRNNCLLNIGKARNEIEFIPWDDLDQDAIGTPDVELLYLLNDIDSKIKK
jgi:uncharacterized protein (DUF849 family)